MTRAPGFWRASWILAAKDLRLEGKTFEALSSMLLFSLIVLLVFSFAFDVREVGATALVPGVLWTALTFSGIIAFARSFQLEKTAGSMHALVLAPIERGALFAGKTLANLVLVLALELVLLPLSVVFFDYDLASGAAPLALVLLVHTLGIAELGTLFAAVAVRVGRGEALLATLLFPAASPLLISAIECTRAVLSGKPLLEVRSWLLAAGGFDVLYFLIALLTFEYVLED